MSGGGVSIEVSMNELLHLKQEFQRRSEDCIWVSSHIDQLFGAIARAIHFPQLAVSATEFLNDLFPCLIVRDDYRRWEAILVEALMHAQNLKDDEFQMRIWAELGQNYLQFGLRNKAYEAFTTASERGEDAHSPLIALIGKIGQLKTHAFFDRGYFNDLVGEILDLAREIDEPAVYGTAHSALALAYMLRAETKRALGHGQTAFAWWRNVGNTLQMGDVALILAEACRLAARMEQADRYLRLAENYLVEIDNMRKSATYAYNKGVWYFSSQQNFHEAEHSLETALSIFEQADFPYQANAARHALALAQIKLGKYTDARCHLGKALMQWRHLRNRYEQANAAHALGFLYFCQGDEEQARRWYRRALNLCEKVPDSPMLENLQRLIHEDAAKLKNVDSL